MGSYVIIAIGAGYFVAAVFDAYNGLWARAGIMCCYGTAQFLLSRLS